MKFLVPLMFVFLPSLVKADHCGQVLQAVQTVTVPVSTVPVIQQIAVPVYSAVYSPFTQQPSQSNQDELLREILLELKSLRAEMQSLKTPVLASTDESKIKPVKNACYACHSQDKADDLGGGFKLFDAKGGLLSVDDADKKRIVTRVSRNSMPPPEKKISQEDKKAILDLFK